MYVRQLREAVVAHRAEQDSLYLVSYPDPHQHSKRGSGNKTSLHQEIPHIVAICPAWVAGMVDALG